MARKSRYTFFWSIAVLLLSWLCSVRPLSAQMTIMPPTINVSVPTAVVSGVSAPIQVRTLEVSPGPRLDLNVKIRQPNGSVYRTRVEKLDIAASKPAQITRDSNSRRLTLRQEDEESQGAKKMVFVGTGSPPPPPDAEGGHAAHPHTSSEERRCYFDRSDPNNVRIRCYTIPSH